MKGCKLSCSWSTTLYPLDFKSSDLIWTLSITPFTFCCLVFKGISVAYLGFLDVMGNVQTKELLVLTKLLLTMTQGLFFPFSAPFVGSRFTMTTSNCFTIIPLPLVH